MATVAAMLCVPSCQSFAVISALTWRSLSLCPALPVGKHEPGCCLAFSRTPYTGANQVGSHLPLQDFSTTSVQHRGMRTSCFPLPWPSSRVLRPSRGPKDGLLQAEVLKFTCMSNHESPCKLEIAHLLLMRQSKTPPPFYIGDWQPKRAEGWTCGKPVAEQEP